jgi:TonB family protein
MANTGSGAERFGMGLPVGFSILFHSLALLLVALASGLAGRAVPVPQVEEGKIPVEVSFAPVPEPKREDRAPRARPERPAEPQREVPPPKPPRGPSRLESSSVSVLAAEPPGRGASGGRSGAPTPGGPASAEEAAAGADRPSEAGSLVARLRDFEQSLSTRFLAPRHAPRGGGQGLGGVDLRDIPQTGFGVGNLEFETGSFDWADYGRQVYWIIWRAWHNRLYLTVDNFEKWAWDGGFLLDHQSRVRFTIESSGNISEVALETPSGCIPLDRSALDALNEAVLPPLPPDFPGQRETVRARFLARGDIRFMRPTLQYLKGKGYF